MNDKPVSRREFLRALGVTAAAGVAKPISVIQLLELKCANCQAALAITGNNTCECGYCGAKYVVGNLDEVVGVEERVESEYHGWADDSYDYFFSPPPEWWERERETIMRARGGPIYPGGPPTIERLDEV